VRSLASVRERARADGGGKGPHEYARKGGAAGTKSPRVGMDSLKNIFAIPELRKRVLFTFGLLAVYRIGGHIPTPGVNTQALQALAQQQASSGLFGLYDIFSGRNLSQMTIFALGVMP
jgi:preprotein translocase subunit SecY